MDDVGFHNVQLLLTDNVIFEYWRLTDELELQTRQDASGLPDQIFIDYLHKELQMKPRRS